MPFGSRVKKEVKERAAFRCCRCQTIGIQVHHIIPQEHDGPDTIENAAPLCATCHDTFGANPVKRKEIAEMRDWWYKVVETRFSGQDPSVEMLEKINTTVEDIRAKQADVTELKGMLKSVADEMINSITAATAPIAASNIVNASSEASSGMLGPEVEVHKDLEEVKESLKVVGITELTQENVNRIASFIELVGLLGGTAEDLGTDYRVSIGGRITNVGKTVVAIMDSELRSIKTV